MKVVHVFVEHPILHLDHTFTYLCDGFKVSRGVRVQVPFGTTSIIGFVESVQEHTQAEIDAYPYPLKAIYDVIDDAPLVNEELFALANFMADEYIAPRISCFQCMLPSQLKPQTSKSKIKMEDWVRIIKSDDGVKLTPKQQWTYDSLKEAKEMPRVLYNRSFKSHAKKLVDLGLVEIFKKQVSSSFFDVEDQDEEKILTPLQKAAMDQILHGKQMVNLLHGVTGSGKTEVFLQLANKVLQEGKQVVVLVPEISLTPQMVHRVTSRFKKQVAIYHSALSNQEKYEQYQLVKEQKVSIVVGTRSAIFMPFDHLGLIILDEEHDPSYKQDKTPRYHCRDIALWRARYHHAKVVLASATPSLESYARAYKGIYQLVTMKERMNRCFPKMHLVDMKKAIEDKQSYILSNTLLDAIYDRLQKKEQVILLLNRRGYTPVLRCISCGYVQMCPHCEVAMSYHKEENMLKCHTCGHTMSVPQYCPSCHQASWRYLGLGTQKLEEFLQVKFPYAKILRMDADTTTKKHAHQNILKAFGNHQADILLGTQMIAKGLDFEDVTLVGIVNGDAMLNRIDYRSAEMTYDLLEQASGRSGRAQKPGEVIIQAYDLDHYAIQCAAKHDYVDFFKHEMQYRHLAGYPPYRYLVSMLFSHKKEEEVLHDAMAASSYLQGNDGYKVLGPTHLHRLKDEYRMRIILKGKDEALLHQCLKAVYQMHIEKKEKSRLDIDVAPVVME